MKRKNRRWRLVADLRVQGVWCARVIVYWLVCQGTMCATIAGMASLEGPGAEAGGSVVRFLVPAFYVSLCALPLALLDTLLFTNRIVGPLFRFRRGVGQLAATQTAEALHFRKGDFFFDLAQQFNRLREIVIQQRRQSAAAASNVSSDCDPITAR